MDHQSRHTTKHFLMPIFPQLSQCQTPHFPMCRCDPTLESWLTWTGESENHEHPWIDPFTLLTYLPPPSPPTHPLTSPSLSQVHGLGMNSCHLFISSWDVTTQTWPITCFLKLLDLLSFGSFFLWVKSYGCSVASSGQYRKEYSGGSREKVADTNTQRR